MRSQHQFRACSFPSQSDIDPIFVSAAAFSDSYRASLQRPASPGTVFEAVFGHHPWWLKLLLIVRNRIASVVGLQAPSASEVLRPNFQPSYSVGDTIGVWPISSLSNTELVAGRDNWHLDFRVSVLLLGAGSPGFASSAIVSTVCVVHNIVGRLYLAVVLPFHRWGIRRLITRAVAEGRL